MHQLICKVDLALYPPPYVSCSKETKAEESVHDEVCTITRHPKSRHIRIQPEISTRMEPFAIHTNNYKHMDDTRPAISKQTSKWNLTNVMHIQVQNETSIYDCAASSVMFTSHFMHYILMFHTSIIACMRAINLLCLIIYIHYSLNFRGFDYMTLLIINVWWLHTKRDVVFTVKFFPHNSYLNSVVLFYKVYIIPAKHDIV